MIFKSISKIMVFVMFCSLLISGIPVKAETFNDLAPMTVAYEMGTGWNLGNVMEPLTEGGWNNPPVQQWVFPFIKNEGFRSIRIPMTWEGHIGGSPTYTVSTAWLDRTETVVDWSISAGLYTVINTHHDSGWITTGLKSTDEATVTATIDKLSKIWAQIAERFKWKNEKLIFEVMNEVSAKNDATIDRVNAAILDVVRKSGGYNDKRILIIGGMGYNINHTLVAAVPNDQHIMMSYHDYMGSNNWGSASNIYYLEDQLNSIKTTFIDKNIPVILGEYGGMSSVNDANLNYYNHLLTKIHQIGGIVPMLWDMGYGPDPLGYISYSGKKWYGEYEQSVINLIMNCDKGIPNTVSTSYYIPPLTPPTPTTLWDFEGLSTSPFNINVNTALVSSESVSQSIVVDPTDENNKTLKVEWNNITNANTVYLYTNSANSNITSIPNAIIKARVYIPPSLSISSLQLYFKNSYYTPIASATKTFSEGYSGGWYNFITDNVPVGTNPLEIGFTLAGCQGSGAIYIDNITVEPPTTIWDFERNVGSPFSLWQYGSQSIETDPTNSANKVLKFSWDKFTTTTSTSLYTSSINSEIMSIPKAVIRARVYVPSSLTITKISISFEKSNYGGSAAYGSKTFATGYTGGWFDLETGQIPIGISPGSINFNAQGLNGAGSIYIDDITIEPGQGITAHDVVFDAGEHGKFNGQQTTVVQTMDGYTPLEPKVTSDVGYTFREWSPEITSSTSATTYTAQYDVTSYNVFFDAGEFGTINGQRVGIVPTLHGSLPQEPTVVANLGHVFGGWNKAIVEATGVECYVAQYSLHNCNITFDAGEHGNIDGQQYVDVTTAVGYLPQEPTVTSNIGYTFTGWSPTLVEATDDAIYTAQYSISNYNITFDAGEYGKIDGLQTKDFIVSHGQLPVSPNISVDTSIEFIGWSPTIEVATKATTYTAQYNLSAQALEQFSVPNQSNIRSTLGLYKGLLGITSIYNRVAEADWNEISNSMVGTYATQTEITNKFNEVTQNIYKVDASAGTNIINESFEGITLPNSSWTTDTTISGTVTNTVSTKFAHTGNNSIEVSCDKRTANRFTPSTAGTYRVVTYMYDDISIVNPIGVVALMATTNQATATMMAGLYSPKSKDYYVYRTGATFYPSTIPRKMGWHKFTFEYTSSKDAQIFIDNVKVYDSLNDASNKGKFTGFTHLVVGDLWTGLGGTTGAKLYFDSISMTSITNKATIPSISNLSVSQNNSTLYANYIFNDANKDEDISPIKWYKSDTINGAYSLISNATTKVLDITEADVGKYFKVAVTPTTVYGRVGTEATSDAFMENYYQSSVSYNITFDAGTNGTIEGQQTAVVPTGYGKMPITPTVIANQGYVFTGWNTTVVVATGDTVYTANYSDSPMVIWNFPSGSTTPLGVWPQTGGSLTIETDVTNSTNNLMKFAWSNVATATTYNLYASSNNSTITQISNAVIKARIYIPASLGITSAELYFKKVLGDTKVASAKITLPSGYAEGWYTFTTDNIENGIIPKEMGFEFKGIIGTGNVYIDDVMVEQGTALSTSSVTLPKLTSTTTITQDGIDVTQTGFLSNSSALVAVKLNNTTTTSLPMFVGVGLYKDARLVKLTLSTNTSDLQNSGITSDYTCSVDIPEGTGYSLKVFTWDSISSMNPYNTIETVNQK